MRNVFVCWSISMAGVSPWSTANIKSFRTIIHFQSNMQPFPLYCRWFQLIHTFIFEPPSVGCSSQEFSLAAVGVTPRRKTTLKYGFQLPINLRIDGRGGVTSVTPLILTLLMLIILTIISSARVLSMIMINHHSKPRIGQSMYWSVKVFLHLLQTFCKNVIYA